MAYWIGISGWSYAGWRGVFYPKGLPQRRELEYAGRCFNSLEINGSFYSLQRPESYRAWHNLTPPGFIFAVKGGRFITHMKKLREVELPLANFFASGVLALEEKLGPILWQFGSNLGLDLERFEAFFQMLPKETIAAGELAKRHTDKLAGRAWTKVKISRPIRYAVEIRHDTFLDARFIQLLRKYNVALCMADTAGKFPYTEDVTADFLYLRLHGAETLYWSGYTEAQLDWWARRAQAWHDGDEPSDVRKITPQRPEQRPRDVYAYFDNDAQTKAPFDAAGLAQRVGVCGLHPPGTPMP